MIYNIAFIIEAIYNEIVKIISGIIVFGKK